LTDFASIIEHPDGREKQISIRENKVINIDLPDSILYVSDTAVGSSGAPVFNDQWQVIALHSAGVAKTNAQGKYVDVDGQVVEPVNGTYDEARLVWESNRGMRVSSIINHLHETTEVATDPSIQALFSPAYTDSRPYAFLSRPDSNAERVAAPVPQLPETLTGTPINISISIGADGRIVTTTPLTPLDRACRHCGGLRGEIRGRSRLLRLHRLRRPLHGPIYPHADPEWGAAEETCAAYR
jgi:endonuclease G